VRYYPCDLVRFKDNGIKLETNSDLLEVESDRFESRHGERIHLWNASALPSNRVHHKAERGRSLALETCPMTLYPAIVKRGAILVCATAIFLYVRNALPFLLHPACLTHLLDSADRCFRFGWLFIHSLARIRSCIKLLLIIGSFENWES
jgi:hypothetical protein